MTILATRVAALFEGTMRRTTLAAIVATACTYALAYGAMQHLPRFVATMPEISVLSEPAKKDASGVMQMIQESGGLVGRFLLAGLVVAVVARPRMLRVLRMAAIVLWPATAVSAAPMSESPAVPGSLRTTARAGAAARAPLSPGASSPWPRAVMSTEMLRGRGIQVNVGAVRHSSATPRPRSEFGGCLASASLCHHPGVSGAAGSDAVGGRPPLRRARGTHTRPTSTTASALYTRWTIENARAAAARSSAVAPGAWAAKK